MTVRDRPVALSLFLSLRPAQWTKNLIVFAGLLFGQRGIPAFLDPQRHLARRSRAFAIFCALSGVVYLDQRRRGSRGGPAAPAQALPTDRVGRGVAAAGARPGGRADGRGAGGALAAAPGVRAGRG